MAVVLLCAVSSASAQGVHFGPQLGIYSARDADQSSVMGGLALRARLTPVLGIDASVNHRQEEYAGGGSPVNGVGPKQYLLIARAHSGLSVKPVQVMGISEEACMSDK